MGHLAEEFYTMPGAAEPLRSNEVVCKPKPQHICHARNNGLTYVLNMGTPVPCRAQRTGLNQKHVERCAKVERVKVRISG